MILIAEVAEKATTWPDVIGLALLLLFFFGVIWLFKRD